MDETRTKVLKNGAVYDMESKRIVKGATLSSDQAAHMAAIREQKKRDVARSAANKAVERSDYTSAYGDLAYLAAIIDAAMMKALTPEDSKSIEAARFVVSMTGDSEPASSAAAVPLAEVRGLLHDIAETARSLQASQQPASSAASEPADSEP
jgi:hypothetical protein